MYLSKNFSSHFVFLYIDIIYSTCFADLAALVALITQIACHVILCHIFSCLVVSSFIMSCRIILYRIVSCHQGQGVISNASSHQAKAKLRLLFEAAPIGLIIEAAGGSTCVCPTEVFEQIGRWPTDQPANSPLIQIFGLINDDVRCDHFLLLCFEMKGYISLPSRPFLFYSSYSLSLSYLLSFTMHFFLPFQSLHWTFLFFDFTFDSWSSFNPSPRTPSLLTLPSLLFSFRLFDL